MKSTIRIAATETASLNSTAFFPPPPPPQLMTEREVCAWLNTSKPTLACWAKAGPTPIPTIGRPVGFARDQVRNALAAMTNDPTQP